MNSYKETYTIRYEKNDGKKFRRTELRFNQLNNAINKLEDVKILNITKKFTHENDSLKNALRVSTRLFETKTILLKMLVGYPPALLFAKKSY